VEESQPLYLRGGGTSDDEEEELRRQILDPDEFQGFREPNPEEIPIVEHRVKEIIRLMKKPAEQPGADLGRCFYTYVENLYVGLKNPNQTVIQDEQDGSLIAYILSQAGDEIQNIQNMERADR